MNETTTQNVREILAPIAEQLNAIWPDRADWHVTEGKPDDWNLNNWADLESGDDYRLSVRLENGRLNISASNHRVPTPPISGNRARYGSTPSQSMSADPARDPAAIARDIVRKLSGNLAAIVAEAQREFESETEGVRLREIYMAELAALGFSTSRGSSEGVRAYCVTAYCPGPEIRRIQFTDTTADVELPQLSHAQALMLIGFVRSPEFRAEARQ